MLCRVVLTAVAVSYLICVLWLSGLQKEDLDVNTLRKLQRHNVNVNDMNNETLKHECAYRSNSTGKSEVMTTSMSAVADHYYEPSQILSGNNNSYYETIAKYLTDKRTASDNNQPEVNQATKFHRQRSYVNFSSTNYMLKREAKIVNENIAESSHPNLQEILQFWQKFKKPILNYNKDNKQESVALRTDDVENLPVTQIVTEMTIQGTPPTEKINQLLSEYIFKNLITLSTTKAPTTTKKPDDLESNLELLYYKLIANKNMKHNSEKIFTTTVTSNTFNDNNDNIFKQQHSIDTNNMGENFRPLEKPIKNMRDLSLLNEELKSYASWHSYQNVMPQMTNQNRNNLQISETDMSNGKELIKSLNKLFSKQPENGHIMNTQTKLQEQIPRISSDVMREIVENVKGLVLKDLREKNIWNTSSTNTASTTMMTTVSRSTQTLKLSTELQTKLETKSDETRYVIEKFMELIEQIKATKERTTTTNETKYRMAEMNHEYLNSINNTPIHRPSVNKDNISYGIQQNRIINLPTFRNSTPHEKRLHPPTVIQTNSDEIAPLIIPISKPKKFNQVLLVTSGNTEQQRWALPVTEMSVYLRHPNSKESLEYASRISNQDRGYKTYRYNDNNYFRAHSRQRPEHYGNNKYTHDRLPEYQKNNDDPFRTNLNNFNEYNRDNREPLYILEHGHIDTNRSPRQHNRERFHEKLERVDGKLANFDQNRYHNGKQPYGLRVAPRYQQPVNSLKKNVRYNDIHIRNFLKTQQKVNAMLERILATKSSTDEPFNSFEIA